MWIGVVGPRMSGSAELVRRWWASRLTPTAESPPTQTAAGSTAGVIAAGRCGCCLGSWCSCLVGWRCWAARTTSRAHVFSRRAAPALSRRTPVARATPRARPVPARPRRHAARRPSSRRLRDAGHRVAARGVVVRPRPVIARSSAAPVSPPGLSVPAGGGRHASTPALSRRSAAVPRSGSGLWCSRLLFRGRSARIPTSKRGVRCE